MDHRRIAITVAGLACSSGLAHAQWSSYRFEAHRAGLTGPSHTRSDGYQSSALFIRDSGRIQEPDGGLGVVGHSSRYTGVSTYNGLNTWTYLPDSGTTVQTGLTAAANTGSAGYQYSENLTQSRSGFAVGLSQRIRNVSSDNGDDAWIFDPNTLLSTRLGLTDGPYFGSQGFYQSEPAILAENGAVAGHTSHITGISNNNGRDAWYFDPVTRQTTRIGFFGSDHTGSNGSVYAWVRGIDANGRVFGTSDRKSVTDSYRGRDIWMYDPANGSTTRIGLWTPEHVGTSGFQESYFGTLTPSGLVIGNSQRVRNVETYNGATAWVYNPATNQTRPMALTGPGFTGTEGYQNSNVVGVNDAGLVVGTSSQVVGNSWTGYSAAWVCNVNEGAPVKIGLTGPEHTTANGVRNSHVNDLTNSGLVAGRSARLGTTSSGDFDTWIYNHATGEIMVTSLTGPGNTGTSGERDSENHWLGEDGKATGRSAVYTNSSIQNGLNTWYFDPVTRQSVRTGITDAMHTGSAGYQISWNSYTTTSGQTTGHSAQITGLNTQYGRSVWVYDPARNATVRIGFFSAEFTGSLGYQSSSTIAGIESGALVGESALITGERGEISRIAWYYDPSTGVTLKPTLSVEGAIRPGDGFQRSDVVALGQDGILYGSFLFFGDDDDPGSERAFVYRPDLGFHDLTQLIDETVSPSAVDAVMAGSSCFVDFSHAYAGNGRVPGMLPVPNGPSPNRAVFVLKRIPPLPQCEADVDDGSGSGVPDGGVNIDDLLYFLLAFEAGSEAGDLDNDGDPVSGDPDGAVDVNDLIFFLIRFEQGC